MTGLTPAPPLQLDAATGAADATLTADEGDSWWSGDRTDGPGAADAGAAGAGNQAADVQGIQAQLDALEAQLASLGATSKGAEQVRRRRLLA